MGCIHINQLASNWLLLKLIIGLRLVIALSLATTTMADSEILQKKSDQVINLTGQQSASLTHSEKVITLVDAVNLSLLHNPELASFAKEIRALGGVTLQAGLLRNPEI